MLISEFICFLFYKIRPFNERGQSSIEYLIVTSALIASLITLPNIYDTISHTMQDKYKSYAFGIAISDPPSKHFDDEIHQTADIIKSIKALLTGSILPDILKGKMPALKDIKTFVNLVKSLF